MTTLVLYLLATPMAFISLDFVAPGRNGWKAKVLLSLAWPFLSVVAIVYAFLGFLDAVRGKVDE